jgi:hypothetical protein
MGTHPADDENVCFQGDQHQIDQIQIGTYPDGQPPFLIENGGQRETTDTAEAVSIILDWFDRAPKREPPVHSSVG